MNKLLNITTIIIISVFILKVSLEDNLDFYIHPRYFSLTNISTIILLVVGVLSIFTFFILKSSTDNDIQKVRNEVKNYIKNIFKDSKFLLVLALPFLSFISSIAFVIAGILILLPIKNSYFDKTFSKKNGAEGLIGIALVLIVVTIALFIPAMPLKSETFKQRSSNINSIQFQLDSSSFNKFRGNTETLNIKEWVATINFSPDIYDFEDNNVDIVGFIFNPGNLSKDYFLAARFIVTCCAVDASPIGLIVNYKDWQNQFKTDDWVRVKGKMKVENINGKNELVIIPSDIEVVKVPDKPYLT